MHIPRVLYLSGKYLRSIRISSTFYKQNLTEIASYYLPNRFLASSSKSSSVQSSISIYKKSTLKNST